MTLRKSCIMLLLNLSLFGGGVYAQATNSAASAPGVPAVKTAAKPAGTPAVAQPDPTSTQPAPEPAPASTQGAPEPAQMLTQGAPEAVPALIQAAPEAVPASSQTAPQPEGIGIPDYPVLRTLGGLGLVLSLIVLGFFAARRYAPQFFNRKPGDQKLKVLESLSMGDKRSIALVRVDGACYLVGNTAHQINLLAQLPLDFAQSRANQAADAGDSFRKLYEVEKKTSAPRGVPKAIPADVRDKMRQLREALEH
jgi:flagellar biosynthetic protein FliO